MRYSAALAISRLQRVKEVVTERQRNRAQRPLERRLAGDLATEFQKQKKTVLRVLRPLASRFNDNARAMAAESITRGDWEYLLTNAFYGHGEDMTALLESYHRASFTTAASTQFKANNTGLVFRMSDPRAIAYAEQNAAARVTNITQTTRDQLNTVISNAIANGDGWPTLRDNIDARFDEFSLSRSKRIAAFEIGDSYEAGSRAAIDEMTAEGFVFEKSWSNAGDERVRPAHVGNANDGWIKLDDTFSSGDEHPPTDPGCRCTLLYRRIPNAKTVGRNQRDRLRAIDDEFRAELEANPTTVRDIVWPKGRAPRGLGQEWKDRKAIVNNIEKHQRWRAANADFIANYRGQKNKRARFTRAQARNQELGPAISSALEIAKGPGDWSFKRELIDGLFEYVSAITKFD